MQKLIVKQPPTLNKLIATARSNKYAGASSKKRWTNICTRAALEQLTPYPDSAEIRIISILDYHTRSSDGDNLNSCIKYILDGVSNAEIIRNDNLMVVLSPQIFQYRKLTKDQPKMATVLFFDDVDEWIYVVKDTTKLLTIVQ